MLFLSTSRVYPYRVLNSLAYRESDERFDLVDQQPVAGVSACGIAEGFPLAGARSLYGMTKLAGELMVEEYADAYGLRAIINRCGVITGPWQMAKSDQGVIALWLASHYFGHPLRYSGFGGDGKQVRDFLHVDDVAELVLDQMEHFDAYRGGVFNVGGGLPNSVSLRECTRLCREITGKTIAIAADPATRPADIRVYVSDCRRINTVRGWRPRRDARATFGDILGWLEQNETQVRDVLFA